MKHLLCATFLGLAALTSAAGTIQAGTFGLFVCHGCGHCCNGCSVCIRQYNAFTPVICGQLPGCCMPSCGGCAPGCAPGCGPVGVIGQTCAAPSNEPAQMAAQYQMYQQQLAAQLSNSYQYMNSWHPDPNAPFKVTGYVPTHGHHVPPPMMQQQEPVAPVEITP